MSPMEVTRPWSGSGGHVPCLANVCGPPRTESTLMKTTTSSSAILSRRLPSPRSAGARKEPPGVLVALSVVAPEMEGEFNRWYEQEAVPDRLALPGVEAVHRYQAIGGNCSYMVVYRCESIEAFTSDAYRKHMASPSAWRLKVRKGFRNIQFSACSETWSTGSGFGGTAVIVQCSPAKGRDAEVRKFLSSELATRIIDKGGIVRMALWEADSEVTAAVDVSSRENVENYTNWMICIESSELMKTAPAIQAELLSPDVAHAGLVVGAIMRYNLLAAYHG